MRTNTGYDKEGWFPGELVLIACLILIVSVFLTCMLYEICVKKLCGGPQLCCTAPPPRRSPQRRTVSSSRLGNNVPVLPYSTPSNAPSPAPIELSNENENGNADTNTNTYAAKTRFERIQSRLVFQQILSLPSNKEQEQRNKKKESKTTKIMKGDAHDDFEAIHEQSSSDIIEHVSSSVLETTSENEHKARNPFVRDMDIEMGVCDKKDDNDDESFRIHRGTNDNSTRTLRSYSDPIQLLVFFQQLDDSTGANEQEILTSKKAMKDQLTCSICLEEYVVGDVVVRLKEDNAGDTTSNGAGTNSCKHCFHEDCILEWLETHDECPLCRVNMLTDNP